MTEPEAVDPRIEAVGARVCRERNEHAQKVQDQDGHPDPTWFIPWDRLPPAYRELDIAVGTQLFAAGRSAALRESSWLGFWEMQRILAALLWQAGKDGLLVTQLTMASMPRDARICEQDTDEGKKLWLEVLREGL